MFAIALWSLVAIVSWFVFWTAASPLHWQAKDKEGVYAALSWCLAMLVTPIVAQQLVHGAVTVWSVIFLTGIYSGHYCLRAHLSRIGNIAANIRANRAA